MVEDYNVIKLLEDMRDYCKKLNFISFNIKVEDVTKILKIVNNQQTEIRNLKRENDFLKKVIRGTDNFKCID